MKTTRHETITRLETSRPSDAYPALPVHLHRVHLVRIESGALMPTGRRDWIGSYPTEELAQGKALVLEGAA